MIGEGKTYMKKTLIFTVALMYILLHSTALAADVSVYFNGEKMEFEKAPYIENERTMVPFRPLFEAVGAPVLWDEDTKTIIAFKTDGEEATSIAFQADQAFAFVNNEKIEIDAAATIKDGFTFVPLRFVMESLGANVVWDGDTYTVNVTTN